ncbi:MAG: hypothetical protein IPN71_20120 [Fibrobacteres bacterium]|nr:hypothetical protein [Fibrobacterota bacterium]
MVALGTAPNVLSGAARELYNQNLAEFDPDDGESFCASNIESDPAYADGG